MANYLAVFTHRRSFPDVAEHLVTLNHGFPGERHDEVLANGWALTWLSHRAAADVVDDSSLFTGVAIDDDRERFYFGACGWRDRGRSMGGTELPGCHLRIRWDQSAVTILGDLYRSMPIFVTAVPGAVMVSDSAYTLLHLRRRLGWPVTADTTVAASLVWANSMSAQLLGARTLVREISYVPVSSHLQLSLESPGSVHRTVHTPVRDHFAVSSTDYREEIRSAATRIASVVHSVASMGEEFARLSLSGGKDSRICLAAALLSPVGREQALFTCTNAHEQHRLDHQVVSTLAEEFGFTLGPKKPVTDPAALLRRFPRPMGMWFMDQALSYFPLKLQSYALRTPGPFSIAGFGSELYKGSYGLRTLEAVVTSIARSRPDVARAVEEVAGESLQDAGISTSEHLSAEWHYLLFRNALHGGRFVPATKLGLRPLQQTNLVALSKLAPEQRPELLSDPRDIPEDLLALLSPALASRPFDRAEKNRSAEQVTSRLRALGGPVSWHEVSTYTLHGLAEDVHGGPLRSLENMVSADMPTGRLVRENLVPWVDRAASIIAEDGSLPDWVELAEQARITVRDTTIPLGHARGDLGRVLSVAEVLA